MKHILFWLALLGADLSFAAAATPDYVGGTVCSGCHGIETTRWSGSHHDLAMQETSRLTVLGDFADSAFEYAGIKSRFFIRGDKYFVRTDGPGGSLQDFQIRYTFGVAPLQQYLVELPGGRLQALGIAWDARPRQAGGQRWFHLYPDESITHTDELHWTGPSQNWNRMCAECHSTNLRKNFSAATNSYQTSWAEIDVSCEACHGPGANHVAWARNPGGTEPENLGLTFHYEPLPVWSPDASTGVPVKRSGNSSAQETETCARCHARRGQLFEDDGAGAPLMESFLPAVLEPGLYHVDGQINGEVFEYGSFQQSRMREAGVTCSNCHEPHSLELKVPGNRVCLQCHGAAKYDSPAHHFHQQDSEGAKCISCHMPEKTYMQVDSRRDHSFRIPQPSVTAALGTPNACNSCHEDMTAEETASLVREWYGHDPMGYQDYANVLHAARSTSAGSQRGLVALLEDVNQPGIARATAALLAGDQIDQSTAQALVRSLGDRDPLVRTSAIRSLNALPPTSRYQVLRPLLADPVRVVRVLAAEALADISVDDLSPAERDRLVSAWREYAGIVAFNGDDPQAWINHGNFLLARHDLQGAESAFRQALVVNPQFVPAWVNLADLLRQSRRDDEGRLLLEEAISLLPNSAEVHHSLGLLMVRAGLIDSAMPLLERAAELAPGITRYSYVYAVALHSKGDSEKASAVIEQALLRTPSDQALLQLRESLKRSSEIRQ